MELTDEVRKDIGEMDLQDLKHSILVEMLTAPMLSPDTAEFLLQTYENKLGELYW
jgi:hypothetical protein